MACAPGIASFLNPAYFLNNPKAGANRGGAWRDICKRRITGWAESGMLRFLGKRLKAWNKPSYYAVKWAIFGGLFYWLFF